MKQLIGRYNAIRYEISEVLPDGEELFLYEAGNSPYDSQVYVSEKDGLGIEKMKRFCQYTISSMSEENGNCPFSIELLNENDMEA